MIVDFLNQPNDDTAIYTASVIRSKMDDDGWKVRGWSSYYSLQEAIETIENNITNIFEDGYYNYGIIEKYYPGLCLVRRSFLITIIILEFGLSMTAKRTGFAESTAETV